MFSELETKKYCLFLRSQMVNVAQLVRAPDCGSGGRRFKPGLSPENATLLVAFSFSLYTQITYMTWNCKIL